MQQIKRWTIAPPSDAAAELAGCLKTSPLIAQILLNRGIASPADCQAFLAPSLHHLHQPAMLPGVVRAAERINQAIRNKEKIVIYGDYDVDGITATAILWHAITLLGGEVDYYIPKRLEEGYGLNSEALRQLADGGARLIVSVDCGVTAIEEVKALCGRGVELIITDHHEWREAPGDDHEQAPPILPECFVVVHPRLPAVPQYPNPYLCGAGVAFKLAWAIGQVHAGGPRVSEDFKKYLIEATALAALGTVADVVPLHGENRTLAHFGLTCLKHTRLNGLRALIASAGLVGQKIDSYHAGFLLAPRLNACGRMGHAAMAVELLTKADEGRAYEIAAYLETQNRERQTIERQIADEAIDQAVKFGYDQPDCRGMVLASDKWHPGVIGIVASRMVNKFNRPAVMIALNNGHGQGSGRSIPGFHLARALHACRDHLEACGGHEMAAGLRMDSTKLENFREAFCAHAQKMVTDEMLEEEIKLDCLAALSDLNEPVVTAMQRLGPFGTGNPKPTLFCQSVQVAGPPRRVGKNANHVQLQIKQNNTFLRCIAFNRGDWCDQLQSGMTIDLAVQPSINEYNGYRNVELEIKDVRVARASCP
jgi:single-stranded-DNA-specific exonuclease